MKPKIPSPLSDLTWTKENELVTLQFNLVPDKDSYLSPDYAKGLHAWFLDQVRISNPELSQVLHDEQTEKAFTISRLEGQLQAVGKKIFIKSSENYQWYLSILSSSLMQWLQEWLSNLPPRLDLYFAPLKITAIKFLHPPTTYHQLFQGRRRKNYSLTFISPTSFRRKGNHFPLPVPTNLFHSYLRRWNNFSGEAFPQEEFLNWIDECVVILAHNIESIKVPGGKRGTVNGFTGAVELTLNEAAKNSPQFCKLYSALCKLAPYCGTGHKTTFGLGQTRLGWLLKTPTQKTMPIEVQLSGRIDELVEIFMEHKKRHGGERAINVCTTIATIVARRELGESLKDIAMELNIPYETARTYSKRGLRILKGKSKIQN